MRLVKACPRGMFLLREFLADDILLTVQKFLRILRNKRVLLRKLLTATKAWKRAQQTPHVFVIFRDPIELGKLLCCALLLFASTGLRNLPLGSAFFAEDVCRLATAL